MSCQDAAFSTPTSPSSPKPTPSSPNLLWTHTHSQCSPHPASGQRLLGSFPPITLPSLWKLIDGSNGDGQMLKLVWRLNSGCHYNIPRLSAPFIIHLDILENIPSNRSGDNKRMAADIVGVDRFSSRLEVLRYLCARLARHTYKRKRKLQLHLRHFRNAGDVCHRRPAGLVGREKNWLCETCGRI